MKLTNRSLLIIIMIVAAVLRFYNYFEIPFTHDEFSALFRTNFPDFQTLINQGVKVDGHPAGVQVFLYYWVQLFGIHEWSIKLPFTFMGIASVYLMYLIAKFWYNETVALISISFFATMQFTVMYSQIARPYISGLFFALLMVYYFGKLIKQSDVHFWKNGLLFVLFASLCTYNHHFSMLFATIVGISGLFLIPKTKLVQYCLLGVLVLLLYLPHVSILLEQLKFGGVEMWLAKPKPTFIFNFIYYLFNFSNLSLLVALGLFLLGVYKFKWIDFKVRSYILFTIWFFLPIAIGYYYSIYYSAVLQFSVLLFSFPFLLMILFGNIKLKSNRFNGIVVGLIILTNTSGLIINRQHYSLFYQSEFEKIIIACDETSEKSIKIIDSHNRITEYYKNKQFLSSNYKEINDFKSLQEFNDYIAVSSEQGLEVFLGVTSSNNPLTVPIIAYHYPKFEKQENFIGGSNYWFTKKSSPNSISDLVYSQKFQGTNVSPWLNISPSKIDTSNQNYKMDPDSEYGPSCEFKLGDFVMHKNNFIDLSMKVNGSDSTDELLLVAILSNNEDEIYWGAASLKEFSIPIKNTDWKLIMQSIKLSDISEIGSNTMLKVFVWNKSKSHFIIDDIEIKIRAGNPILYSLFNKIERSF